MTQFVRYSTSRGSCFGDATATANMAMTINTVPKFYSNRSGSSQAKDIINEPYAAGTFAIALSSASWKSIAKITVTRSA